MIEKIRIQDLLKKLVVPKEDLADLSFCAANKESHIAQWVKALPLTQIQPVAVQLYTALHEISRLAVDYQVKLAMLEILRGPVHQILDGLALKYLNQPLILPEAALKTATIAQAIQKHLLNGYLNVLLAVSTAAKQNDGLEEKALATQRALTALGLLILRSYQLYLPIAGQRWLEVHTLYQLACALDVESLSVDDPLPNHRRLKTIHGIYLRILLLATSRSNQLRQDEIETTYNALELLSPLADLENYDPKGRENLYLVLTDDVRPPFYKSHWRPSNRLDRTTPLELRTQRLIGRLREEANASTKPEITTSKDNQHNLSIALINHLEQAWSHLAQRSFERQSEHNDIEITLGLANIHFQIAGEQPFNQFLNRARNAMNAATKSLPGADAGKKKSGILLKTNLVEQDDGTTEEAIDIDATFFGGQLMSPGRALDNSESESNINFFEQYPTYSVPMSNRSPGGYGLEWRDEIPLQVKAGELLGLREYGRNKWAVGVVRWVHQVKGATQLGIQVLAPKAVAVGIAIVHNTGGFSEHLRALQIPELKAINQPASLITNAISFHEYSNAKLYIPPPPEVEYEGDLTIQLTQRIFSTGAFSQFAYQVIATPKPKEQSTNTSPKADFGAAWE